MRPKQQSPWYYKQRATETPLPEGFIERLLVPDGITQSQQEDRYAPALPERRLWRAVLQDAAEIYLGKKVPMPNGSQDKYKVNRTRVEATEWIDRHCGEYGGFDWVCNSLGINPQWLRGMLERERAAKRRVA
jgi:hypothetical protein